MTEGRPSGTRLRTPAITMTVKVMVAPRDGSPLRITQRATVGRHGGSLPRTAVVSMRVKVTAGRLSGGQANSEPS